MERKKVGTDEGHSRERTSDIDKRPTKGRRRAETEELCGKEQVPKAKTNWKAWGHGDPARRCWAGLRCDPRRYSVITCYHENDEVASLDIRNHKESIFGMCPV